ncbi:MAG TPA: F0F1 ATP synthase subunit A [Actinomycetes bacterium]|nr:F0F1 ATP synthase subunit A [Actinomycetes bacterium]
MRAPTLPLAAEREGFHAPGIEIFEWPDIVHLEVAGIDLSINRVVLQMFLVALLVWGLFFLAFRSPRLVPKGLQNVMEAFVDFIRNQIVLEVIGRDGLRFLPYLTTLFVFVLFGNLGGVLPVVQFPLNGRMALPAVMAICSLLLFISVGISSQGGAYFKNALFPPGIPWPVYVLLTPIEFVSTFIVRPVTLAIRLLANMIAGHLILSVFFVATGYMLTSLNISMLFGVGALVFSVALIAFELFVAGLQAYVFTILSAVYIAGALEPEH